MVRDVPVSVECPSTRLPVLHQPAASSALARIFWLGNVRSPRRKDLRGYGRSGCGGGYGRGNEGVGGILRETGIGWRNASNAESTWKREIWRRL